MLAPILARRDPTLRARILTERKLEYHEPPPGHPKSVRSGSGLVAAGDRMVVIQDDADLIAVIEGEGSSVVGLPLKGSGGGRSGGKLQLEAIVAARDWKSEFLLAFGAGSSPDRRRMARVRLDGGDTEISLYDTRKLYEALDELDGFATSQLDIEGAALVPRASEGRDAIRLFQRGHGPEREGVAGGGGLPATVDLRLDALIAYLERSKRDPDGWFGVDLENLRRYDLGTFAGVPVGFTDAAGLSSGRVVYIGTAEMGLELGEEGEVLCAVLGVIELDGSVRYTLIEEPDGEATMRRAEGLAMMSDSRAFIVIDQSQTAGPALLCELTLGGL